MKDLRRFCDIISGASWLYMTPLMSLYVIVFELSWKQLIAGFLIDGIGFGIVQAIHTPLLFKKMPLLRLYYKYLDVEGIAKLGHSERVELVSGLMAFPRFWAGRCFLLSFIKNIPVGLWVLWCTKDLGVPLSTQLLKLLFNNLFVITYFTSVVFIESHDLASRHLRVLHEKLDLSEIFRKIPLPELKRDFEFHENTALIGIWAFMLSLQILVIESPRTKDIPLSVMIPAMSVMGLLLVTRIWTISRKYIVGGLNEIFELFNEFDPKAAEQKVLTLHTLPVLSRFEKIINSMTDRLRDYERELSSWIFKKAEESRYSALGEISGLIVHDLSAPLHVIHFCTQQMKENPEKIFDERYREQLALSGERALDLITALKTYLRAPGAEEACSVFSEVHKYVFRMLSIQFHMSGFRRVRFTMSPGLEDLRVNMARGDLIHILMNLHSNSVENLLDSGIEDPQIHIKESISRDGTEAEILISDNGTGLSPARFEELTSFVYQGSGEVAAKGSLGLRLVRRLVERYGGSLTVASPAPDQRGTVFRLCVKVRPLDASKEAVGS